MLAQQIIFSLFHYELRYLYSHASPLFHQKFYPYIANRQSIQITLNWHSCNATEHPLSCQYKNGDREEKATPS